MKYSDNNILQLPGVRACSVDLWCAANEGAVPCARSGGATGGATRRVEKVSGLTLESEYDTAPQTTAWWCCWDIFDESYWKYEINLKRFHSNQSCSWQGQSNCVSDHELRYIRAVERESCSCIWSDLILVLLFALFPNSKGTAIKI